MPVSIPPALVLAGLLSTAYAAAFHLIVGGRLGRLLLYLLAGWIGFAIGHALGARWDTGLPRIGQVYVFSATIGSWLALVLARWLIPVNWEGQ